ncbi:cytochrome P450 [Phytohabitans flavus]|uniref:cytochrome P450 n=1 Tax=Phytohabitans flavus TaxID=1076124 RepID=UPI0015646D5C|nr:cytochrome P450 [Phytohabitans flavus]
MTASATRSTDLPAYPVRRVCPYHPAAGHAELREVGPMRRVRLYDGRTTWLVTGPAEGRALLADKRLSNRADFPDYPVMDESHKHMRATREMAAEEEGGFAGALFGVDPPEHTRQRQMLIPKFTVRRVAEHRPAIQRIVDERLAAMLREPAPADFVSAFATPVPMMVVCEFLGIPFEDRQQFEGPAWGLFEPEGADDSAAALTAYIERLVEAKAAAPGKGLIDDLVAGQLRTGELTVSELAQFAQAILVAGTVTTSSIIGLGTLALLENPAQYAALRDNPDLVPGAVEELLRHISLVEQLARVATEDIEIAGEVIKAGDGLLVSFAAANLDPSVTDHPGELDVTRPPTNHLAFSFGIHHCLGHNLARLELEIVFRALVERAPVLRSVMPTDQIPTTLAGDVTRLLCFPVIW